LWEGGTGGKPAKMKKRERTSSSRVNNSPQIQGGDYKRGKTQKREKCEEKMARKK